MDIHTLWNKLVFATHDTSTNKRKHLQVLETARALLSDCHKGGVKTLETKSWSLPLPNLILNQYIYQAWNATGVEGEVWLRPDVQDKLQCLLDGVVGVIGAAL